MRRGLLIEEFHVTVFARRELADAERRQMQQTLHRAAFVRAFQRHIQELKNRYPSLKHAIFTLSK